MLLRDMSVWQSESEIIIQAGIEGQRGAGRNLANKQIIHGMTGKWNGTRYLVTPGTLSTVQLAEPLIKWKKKTSQVIIL